MTIKDIQSWLDRATESEKQQLVEYLNANGYYLIEPKSIGDEKKVERLIEELKSKPFAPR